MNELTIVGRDAIHISDQFDGGNIKCISAVDPGAIRLRIKPDKDAEFRQWFYFRLTGAAGRTCRITIENANEASYAKGWQGYRAVAADGGGEWLRIPTRFDGANLLLRLRPTSDVVSIAYFAPYDLNRQAAFTARAAAQRGVRLECLGETLEGRTIDCLTVGRRTPEKRVCWIIARQHPGETMAAWWMEGFVDRLLDDDDALARTLRQKAVFHIVPNMNPDGAFRGHLRANAAGINLNREWQEPSAAASPEVLHVRNRMIAAGMDLGLDVHGDEILPYAFISGSLGIPSLTARQRALHETFTHALVRANPDFQTEKGYPTPRPGGANMALFANFAAETFGCLAMTLEQPFKDAANNPNPKTGWSPARSAKLGAACLDAIAAVVDDLR